MKRSARFSVVLAAILGSVVYCGQDDNRQGSLRRVPPVEMSAYLIRCDNPEAKVNRLADILLTSGERAVFSYSENPTTILGTAGDVRIEVYRHSGAWRWGNPERKYAGTGQRFGLSDDEVRQVADRFGREHPTLLQLLPEEGLEFEKIGHVRDRFFDDLTGLFVTRTNSGIATYRRMLNGHVVVNSGVFIYVDSNGTVVAIDALWPDIQKEVSARARQLQEVEADLARALPRASIDSQRMMVAYKFDGWASSQSLLEPMLFVTDRDDQEHATPLAVIQLMTRGDR
jgi:hypothetical protein